MLRLTRPYLKTSICVLFIMAFCAVAQAQSGRRATKPLSPPTATPTPSAEPTPKSKPEVKQQTLFVGMDPSMDVPIYMSDAVWNGFIARFGKVSSVMLSANKNMSRKEASDKAKKQEESFVVFLQLTTPGISGGTSQGYLEDLVVSYSIFSPGTGKVKESGQVYVRSNRSILSNPLPTGRSGEAQLKEAGRETAERVMALLHVGSTAMKLQPAVSTLRTVLAPPYASAVAFLPGRR